jgi:RNA polymerase sigma-70 factor (ECF subfamily)
VRRDKDIGEYRPLLLRVQGGDSRALAKLQLHTVTAQADADLLYRAAEDDRLAFEALYLRYWRDLLNFVRQQNRSLDEHAAEDVLSEVFLRVWQDRCRPHCVRSLRAYLRGIAQNVAARNYRGGKLDGGKLPPDAASPIPTPDVAMERDELGDQIAHALASLAQSHRHAMELVQDGLSAKQIASTADCTEKAVQRRLAKARKQMRNMLSRCGSSCALDQRRPDQCPARKENLHCLKWLYVRGLRCE